MSKRDVEAFVQETRDELAATLDELEHRLSPQEMWKSTTSRISQSYDRNPARWLIGGAIAIVGAVAAVLWAVLSDDD